MQIFALDRSPLTAAHYHNNKHVVKMPVETAQLLSTAHHVLDGEDAISGIYKSTHINHPCAVWVRESKENYIWAYFLAQELLHVYLHRYGEFNKLTNKPPLKVPPVLDRLRILPRNIPTKSPNIQHLTTIGSSNILQEIKVSKFARALPATYDHIEDTVEAYRQFYIYDKLHIAKWYRRVDRKTTEEMKKPHWYPELI